jgi:methyl-accepting chemotaxis protein
MAHFLDRISIHNKIPAAISVILLCSIGLGTFSIIRLNGVDAAAAEVTTNWLPSSTVLGDLAMEFRWPSPLRGPHLG